MGEEKLEEVLDRSKLALRLDRKGLSARLAKFLDLRAGNGQKVSISKGSKIQKMILENISSFVTFTVIEKGKVMPVADVHALTGMGLMFEAFGLKPTSKLYGGYYIIYA